MSHEEIRELARALADEMNRYGKPSGEILTRAEAMQYVKRMSQAAFCDWCRKWSVRAANRGRYSRNQLDRALQLEARRRTA